MRGIKNLLLTLLLLSLGILGCANRQEEPLPPRQPSASVRVDNRSPTQVTVYAVRSGQRVRLGVASGSATTLLRIPESLLLGASPLRFQMDPLGGNRRSTSYEMTILPGDQVMVIYP